MGGGSYAGTVFSVDGIAPTIKANSGGNSQPMIVERKVMGGVYVNASPGFQRGVLPDVSRAIKAESHDAGIVERIIVASRGRNPSNPSDRTAGSPTEQRLEPNTGGVSVVDSEGNVQGDGKPVLDPYGVVKQLENGTAVSYRLRKLTPLECWRLMGCTDDDYNKAAAINSKAQLYKEAGNAIVVPVLEAIFSQMNIKGVTSWNERTSNEAQDTQDPL